MHVSTGPLRSVPGYAFPFTEQTEHIQKRARLQPVGLRFHANTRLVTLIFRINGHILLFARLRHRPHRNGSMVNNRGLHQLSEPNLRPALAGPCILADLFVSFGMVVGLLIFSRARFHLDRSHWGFMVFYGLTLAVFNSMWTFSVQYNGAAVATVLAFSSPAMTAILSRILFKEKFNRFKDHFDWLSLIGTIFVSGAYDPAMWKLNPQGIVFGLLTGLFFAIYNLEGKHRLRYPHRSVDSLALFLCQRNIVLVFIQSWH